MSHNAIHQPTETLEPLHETASIGAGHMATALAQVFHQPVSVRVVDLHVTELESALEKIMARDVPVIATVVKVEGDLAALHVCIAPASLVSLVPHIAAHNPDLTQSFWLELGNILSGSALNAFSRFLHLSFTQSVPDCAAGKWGAVADAVLAQFGNSTEPVLLWSAAFTFDEALEAGTFCSVLFCTPTSTRTVLASLSRLSPDHHVK